MLGAVGSWDGFLEGCVEGRRVGILEEGKDEGL